MWRRYEGNFSYHSSSHSYTGRRSDPIFQYLHHCDSKQRGLECMDSNYVAVIGGVVYRSAKNKCLQVRNLWLMQMIV